MKHSAATRRQQQCPAVLIAVLKGNLLHRQAQSFGNHLRLRGSLPIPISCADTETVAWPSFVSVIRAAPSRLR